MKTKVYLSKCFTFNEVLLELACGEVVLCTSDSLELRIKDNDGHPHNVILEKGTLRLFASILNDYFNNL